MNSTRSKIRALGGGAHRAATLAAGPMALSVLATAALVTGCDYVDTPYTNVVVDNDYHWGQFAELLAAASSSRPASRSKTIDDWWRDRGATRHAVRSEWRFDGRADLRAVLRIEFPDPVTDAWLARNPAATSLTYGYVLFAVTRHAPPIPGPGAS